MKLIVIDREDTKVRTLQWENLEDFNKFIHDIESVQRDALVWPNKPLEMPLTYLTINVQQIKGPVANVIDIAKIEG